MLGVHFTALFAFAALATYLAVYRSETAPRVSTGVSWLAWALTAASAGSVTTQAGTQGSIAVQGLAVVMTLATLFAFVGAILEKYPPENLTNP